MPTSPRERRRRTPKPPPTWRILGGLGLLAALAFAGREVWRYVQAHRVVLQFEGAGAEPIELTWFAAQLAFAAPSPPPPLGQRTLAAGTTAVTLGADLVPDAAVVRYAAPGAGTGFLHVRLGEPVPPIALRPAGTVRGRVVEPVESWSFGWRCAELRPVAGALVLVMGGGEHGIELARTRTDAAGAFEATGFDRGLDGLGLRVVAPGFALGHRPFGRDGDAPTVALAAAEPVAGQIVAPAGFDPSALRVLARGLPGVECAPAKDGTFVLDHVPTGMRPRLVLHGLPRELAHAPLRALPAVRIELVAAAEVRGRVLDAATEAPIAGALVSCGDVRAARSDAEGRFELLQLPPGPNRIDAQLDLRHGRQVLSRRGSQPVQLRAGEPLDDLVVRID